MNALRLSELRPVIAVERTIIYRFAEMIRFDSFARFEVGDCSGDFQNSIVGAGGQSLFEHRPFEQVFALRVERAE